MATLRQYFDTDFSRILKVGNEWCFVDAAGAETRVLVRLHFDFEANATFLSAYLPASADQDALLEAVVRDVPRFLHELSSPVQVGFGIGPERLMRCSTLQFAGRIFIYTEAAVPAGERVADQAQLHGLHVQIRDTAWAHARDALERPLAFIAHDSRDKDGFARPLAEALARLACPVWYDEYSLKVGDRLREAIERGLAECRKCILVISPYWLSNSGWTRTEFDAVFTREHVEGQDVMLPVWCGVTREAVYAFSPTLANRYAIAWSTSDQVAAALRRVIV